MKESHPYTKELTTALQAVYLASLLTKAHLLSYKAKKSKVSEETKADESEVTTADFAAQAVLISIIHAVFPDDVFIAEESGEMLRADSELLNRVWKLVESLGAIVDKSSGMDTSAILASLPRSKQVMVDIIDLGQKGGLGATDSKADAMGKGLRTWILDPIDGTKTYIRGQQYAVCLSLVDGEEQKIGVLGCPNLNIKERDDQGRIVVEEFKVEHESDGGWILSAVKEQGVTLSRLRNPFELKNLEDVIGSNVRNLSGRMDGERQSKIELHFTDSGASSHTSKDLHNRVFEHFAHPEPASRKMSVSAIEGGSMSLALDVWSMQFKYVVLVLRAVGADAMIRVPPQPDYHACVWDHAGGQLLLTEANGLLTDANGKAFVIDGRTRKLVKNWGVCAVRGGLYNSRDGSEVSVEQVHAVVLAEVKAELDAHKASK